MKAVNALILTKHCIYEKRGSSKLDKKNDVRTEKFPIGVIIALFLFLFPSLIEIPYVSKRKIIIKFCQWNDLNYNASYL